MPAKIRKKSETGGLKQPDQVMTGLQTTYAFLDKYKYYIVGGFSAVVAVLLAISWFVDHQEQKKEDLAKEFFEAFKYTEAVVGEDALAPAGLPKFNTAEEKYAKVSETLGAFLEEHSSETIADTARLVLASNQMETGDYEKAYALLQEYAENVPDSTLTAIVYENMGYACMHLGKLDEAAAHFDQMKGATTNPYLIARALTHLGDMSNPGATAGGNKDATKAREFYNEALEFLPETEEGAEPDPVVVRTRQELELRLSLLNLS